MPKKGTQVEGPSTFPKAKGTPNLWQRSFKALDCGDKPPTGVGPE